MVIRLKKVLRGLGRLALVLLVLCAAVLALLGLLRWRGLLLFAQEADPDGNCFPRLKFRDDACALWAQVTP